MNTNFNLDTLPRDKLAELLQKSGLKLINQDLNETIDLVNNLEITLDHLPESISNKIDSSIEQSVNRLISAANESQNHVEELQSKNTALLNSQLTKAQTDFICSAKDSLDHLIKPHSDKLAEIPNSINDLSNELENISNKINSIGKPKSSSFVAMIVMVLSLIVGGIGGISFADNYNSETLKTTESNYLVLTTSIDATLAELPKAQKNKVLKILKKHIIAETSKKSK